MRKQLTIFLILIFVLSLAPINFSSAQDLSDKLSGKILLQVEGVGQAWYIDPETKERAFLGRPADAFKIMKELGLGISEDSYNSFNGYAPSKLSGKILLRVEANGEAYYVFPDDLKMHYLGKPADAFDVMRKKELGITDKNLNKVPVFEKYKEQVEENTEAINELNQDVSNQQEKIDELEEKITDLEEIINDPEPSPEPTPEPKPEDSSPPEITYYKENTGHIEIRTNEPTTIKFYYFKWNTTITDAWKISHDTSYLEPILNEQAENNYTIWNNDGILSDTHIFQFSELPEQYTYFYRFEIEDEYANKTVYGTTNLGNLWSWGRKIYAFTTKLSITENEPITVNPSDMSVQIFNANLKVGDLTSVRVYSAKFSIINGNGESFNDSNIEQICFHISGSSSGDKCYSDRITENENNIPGYIDFSSISSHSINSGSDASIWIEVDFADTFTNTDEWSMGIGNLTDLVLRDGDNKTIYPILEDELATVSRIITL